LLGKFLHRARHRVTVTETVSLWSVAKIRRAWKLR